MLTFTFFSIPTFGSLPQDHLLRFNDLQFLAGKRLKSQEVACVLRRYYKKITNIFLIGASSYENSILHLMMIGSSGSGLRPGAWYEKTDKLILWENRKVLSGWCFVVWKFNIALALDPLNCSLDLVQQMATKTTGGLRHEMLGGGLLPGTWYEKSEKLFLEVASSYGRKSLSSYGSLLVHISWIF